MPLRDHFRPPLDEITSWEGFHGGWPMVIVQELTKTLLAQYVAAPYVKIGTFASKTKVLDADEYEVRIYDTKRNRRLVAAIELVSPANKDRPEHRQVFVAKCAALLAKHVSLVIVDLITTRHANLYAELLRLLAESDPSLGLEPSPLYVVACRWGTGDNARLFNAWHTPLELGGPLPTVPLWLSDGLALSLDLEQTYEKTCKDLRIP